MTVDRTLYARQIALAELGLDGQTRLADTPVALAALPPEAAELYLRAGGALDPAGLLVGVAPRSGDGPCVDLGLGAFGAIEAARRVLGEGERELPDALWERLLP